MKKRGKVVLISSCFVGGLLLGILLHAVLSLPIQQPMSAATTPNQTSAPTWDATQVYLGGDTVSYQDRTYRAKWWTQGEIPASSDVWEIVDIPASPTVTTPVSPLPTISAAGFKVVGYYPSWKPEATSLLRWDVLTHVVYAFAIPTTEGGLRPLENAATAQTLLSQAHEKSIPVLLAVGGWSYQDVPLESTFMSVTATAEKRQALVNALLSMCTQYGFDGIDVDWEHPRVDGASASQYEAFMLLLAERLHEKGLLLTSAVLSGATPDGNIYYDAAAHSDKVLASVDWIHVMAYDGGDGPRHSPYDFAVASGQYWKQTRALPAEKVVLGLPFYGRPSWASYADILQQNPQAWNTDTSTINGMQAYYNGMDTIRKKTRYAVENLGGVMVWEITQDTTQTEHSLFTAIAQGISS